ncbi:MAG: gamma-glutamyltransferase [Acidiferrobacterales bacterium]
MITKGVVAAGHRKTAEAAKIVLQAGGNAFDAVLAAQFAACVVEPVFTSLGGGGFLLAHTACGQDTLYDFFTQTPLQRLCETELDFYPIHADFGTTTQEFHIGIGSIAVPGTVKGLFRIHRDLCTLPMARIMEPAIAFARRGVKLNKLQAYSFRVLETILTSNAASFALYRSADEPQRLLIEGECHTQPEFADTLELLAQEGEALFYRGDVAQRIIADCRTRGGSLTRDDLKGYRVIKRKPLAIGYRGNRLLTNPPPSSGGVLIALALKLLEQLDVHALRFGSAAYLSLLARTMEGTNRARAEIADRKSSGHATARKLLGKRLVRSYRTSILQQGISSRGTTHISVVDSSGNLASMTTSNGEGSAYVIPGTGIMLNNMLGEEDINPGGFHQQSPGQRLSSMVSPTLIFRGDGASMTMGSGGSNRIRTAMLQVLLNLFDFGTSLRTAVNRPRIHFENGLLSIEPGFRPAQLARLEQAFPHQKLWGERNLFFGGVHIAGGDAAKRRFCGAGDPRRGGAVRMVG